MSTKKYLYLGITSLVWSIILFILQIVRVVNIEHFLIVEIIFVGGGIYLLYKAKKT